MGTPVIHFLELLRFNSFRLPFLRFLNKMSANNVNPIHNEVSVKVYDTTVISVDPTKYEDSEYLDVILRPAVEALKAGNPIGLPTETVYGLAANCMESAAASRIFQVKNRPTDNPLIVHISDMKMLGMVVDPFFLGQQDDESHGGWKRIKAVTERFWPGPLTLLLPAHPNLPETVTAGLSTVGVRFPSHPIAKALIARCGFPLAAPSANLSGRPSPTTADHVLNDLKGKIEWIVDGGSSQVGLESTVVDLLKEVPMILRPGGITLSMMKPLVPELIVYQQQKKKDVTSVADIDEDRPPTPGMKYRHYSPTAPVILFSTGDEIVHPEKITADYLMSHSQRLLPAIKSFLQKHADKKIVRLTISRETRFTDHPVNYSEISLSESADLIEIAQNLFGALRAADHLNPDFIVAEAIPEDDEGLAIMNRLSKAASEVILA